MNHVLFHSLGYCDYSKLPAKLHLAKTCNKYPTALSQVLYSYKVFGTLVFHLEASPTSELHPGPPQHTQEELGISSPHLLVLEVQDQTSSTLT